MTRVPVGRREVGVAHRYAVQRTGVVDAEHQPVAAFSQMIGQFKEKGCRSTVMIAEEFAVEEHLAIVLCRADAQEVTAIGAQLFHVERARVPGAALKEVPLILEHCPA